MTLRSILGTTVVVSTLILAVALIGDAVERPFEERIEDRARPSVFQAWNGIGDATPFFDVGSLSRHDLIFAGPEFFGLSWQGDHPGNATAFTPASRLFATAFRKRLLAANTGIVLLAELRYRDAPETYLPADHPWWKREHGERVAGWKEGGYFLLDFANPEFREHVARQAMSLMQTGVVDGIMLDWWTDDDDHVALIREIRDSIGDEPLVLVNANDRQIPRSATFVNGLFMECTKSATPEDWTRIAATLEWAEHALKAPRINCLETWWHESRSDLPLMRMTTALSLVLSDGYCLFSDPNPLPTPDHLHDWYPFWDIDLGRPRGRGERHADGSIRRRFDHGLAVYNPPGNHPATISLPSLHRSVSSGIESRTFELPGGDGDCYLDTSVAITTRSGVHAGLARPCLGSSAEMPSACRAKRPTNVPVRLFPAAGVAAARTAW